MGNKVVIAGVGMVPFSKPGRSDSYDIMGANATRLALDNAGLKYNQVKQAYAGFVYGDSTSGQRALYQVGMTGIPIVNVNNNCSTGSTALFLARQAVESGAADCVLALGFEQMNPGALGSVFTDRVDAMGRLNDVMHEIQGVDPNAPIAAQHFGGAGKEYQDRYGMKTESFAQVSVKARLHASNNPNAIFRDLVTLEEVMESKPIYGPLTRFQCCPPTCGAAAAIVCTEAFARAHNVAHPVAILAQAMTTDGESTYTAGSMMTLIGYDMAESAAKQVYEQAGIGPDAVDVVELHDCFTANEVISYESLGLTPEGTAERFILDGDNTYGGKVVVNPSGGLLSKGHPLGATGLAQCTELVEQLRGNAGKRQVDGARLALQHNLGLGGACVITLYGQV